MARNKSLVTSSIQDQSTKKRSIIRVIESEDSSNSTDQNNKVASISNFIPTPEQLEMFEEYGLGEALQACVLGNLEKFRSLIATPRQLGSVSNTKDKVEGSDAMLWACFAGQEHIVDEILKRMPDKIDSKNKFKQNALHMACMAGAFGIAQKLYALKPSLLNDKDDSGKTVMHYAVQGGNASLCKWVHILDGKQLNSKDEDGNKPLDSIENSDSDEADKIRNEILKVLKIENEMHLKKKARISLSDDGTLSDDEETTESSAKRSAVAVDDNSEDRVASTTDSGNKSSELHHKKRAIQQFQKERAADQQNASTADNRVAVAAQLVSKAQNTIELFDSIHLGNLEKVKSLVLADETLLSAQNQFGFNIVHAACKNGKWEIAEFLLSKAPNLIKSTCTSGNVFDVANRCKDKVVKDVMLRELFKREPEFFKDSVAKLDINYRKGLGLIANAPVDASKTPPPPPMPVSDGLGGLMQPLPLLVAVAPQQSVAAVAPTSANPSSAVIEPETVAKVTSSNQKISEHIRNRFLDCIRSGALDSVKNYLMRYDAIIDVNIQAVGSVFHYACKYNKWGIIELLLSKKPEFIDQRNRKGQTGYNLANDETKAKLDAYKQRMAQAVPAAVASTVANPVAAPVAAAAAPVEEATEAMYIKALDSGNLDEVMRLLEVTNNKFLNYVNSHRGNAFHLACFRGEWEVAEKLLGLNQNFLKSVANNGANAFHIACANGKWEVAEKLLNLNPDFINSRNNLGKTGYYLATDEIKAKLDEYKQRMAQAVLALVEPAQPQAVASTPVVPAVAKTPASLLDRVNAFCDVVVNTSRSELNIENPDLQRALNAGGIVNTLTKVEKFLSETSQLFLGAQTPAANGSVVERLGAAESVFKDMIKSIGYNQDNKALSEYLGK